MLVARQPWSSEACAALLSFILRREPLQTATVPNLFKPVGPGRSYDFVREMALGTIARNDLAHSSGSETANGWSMSPRSTRHVLRELASPSRKLICLPWYSGCMRSREA